MIQSTDEYDNVTLAELVAQLQRSTATEQRIEIEEFIGIDDSVAVCALATEEEILAEAESNNHNTDDENEDQQDPEEQFQPSTIFEALNAITVLQKFVAFNDQFNTDDTHTLRSMKPQFLMLHFYGSDCQQQNSELEVRSVFLNCDLEDVISFPDNEVIRFQREEILKHNTLRNCKKKLAVTVKLCDIPSKTTGDEFIPIEHVLDAHNKRIRLLNPYILRLRREKPSQLYKIRKMEIVTGVFGANIQKGSRSHLVHKKYSEDTTSTKYDTLDNSDVYHMDTSNAFSDDSAQMSYFENTEHHSVIPDKGKILFQDATESNHNGKNKINNLTNDNQYVLYEIGNAELWYKSQIEVFEKMTLESKIMWNDLTKREIASVSSLDPLWKNQDMSVRHLTKDVVKREDFDLPSGGLCLVLPLNYARENFLPKDINIKEKFRGKYQNTKKCFSSKDMQNVEPRWRRRKGDMRKWMTPQAEALSADIWDYGLSPTGEKKCDCRQPLLNDITRNELKQQILHDSEQDDTAYVLTQIQKSKESLKH
ncbi:unnamed protein product [Pieris brassicae]|uniref:Uncharacterized protein n=1 Tax=Pieris brassicae TaxID=7116 RepID=A0A9P0TPR8_PIEBR|nr:unnamed protein product [Pieris brassicae]